VSLRNSNCSHLAEPVYARTVARWLFTSLHQRGTRVHYVRVYGEDPLGPAVMLWPGPEHLLNITVQTEKASSVTCIITAQKLRTEPAQQTPILYLNFQTDQGLFASDFQHLFDVLRFFDVGTCVTYPLVA
jgi:hypothetical protein